MNAVDTLKSVQAEFERFVMMVRSRRASGYSQGPTAHRLTADEIAELKTILEPMDAWIHPAPVDAPPADPILEKPRRKR